MSTSEPNHPTNIVILGAGIIGLSTAYYITAISPTTTIHILDTSPTLFACASGRAAGFLGSPSWFSPELKPLATLSRGLHKQLSDENNGAEEWGYARSIGVSLVEDGQKGRGEDWILTGGSRSSAVDDNSENGKGEEKGNGEENGGVVLEWLKKRGSFKVIDDDAAQVYPKLLCEFLLQSITSRGGKVYNPATATKVLYTDGSVSGITFTHDGAEETINCSHVLLSAGPWTPSLFTGLFPKAGTKIPISNLPGTSVQLTPKAPLTTTQEDVICHAVFAVSSHGFSPELFSRRKGDIHFAGLNNPHQPLPNLATEASPLRTNVKKLVDEAADMVNLEGYDVGVGQLCHRPVSDNGVPIICKLEGKVLGVDGVSEGGSGGVYIASGHSVWGIALSLGTGKVMAELMLGRETSVDISGLGLP